RVARAIPGRNARLAARRLRAQRRQAHGLDPGQGHAEELLVVGADLRIDPREDLRVAVFLLPRKERGVGREGVPGLTRGAREQAGEGQLLVRFLAASAWTGRREAEADQQDARDDARFEHAEFLGASA